MKYFIAIILGIVLSFTVQSQPAWQQINVPAYGTIENVYSNGEDIIIYDGSHFFKNKGDLSSWEKLDMPSEQYWHWRNFTDGKWHFHPSLGSLIRTKDGMEIGKM